MKMGYRIFSQYGNIIGKDHLRKSMIDFRVDMVRSSGKDDSSVSGFVQKPDRFFPFASHIFPAGSKFCAMHRVLRNKSRFLTVRILITSSSNQSDKQWFLRF